MKIINKIKNIFMKKQLSQYELIVLEKKAELNALLDILYKNHHKDDDDYYQNNFNISDFLENKVEKYLNANLHKYFNVDPYGRETNMDIILKKLLEEKIMTKFDKLFTKETEEKIKKEINSMSLYHIKNTDPFKKFMSEYFEKNKIEIAIKLREVINNEKFIDEL